MSFRNNKTATQTCPNCLTAHDVSVYVSGQKLQCKCGIRFEVKRLDVSMLQSAEKYADAAMGVEPTITPHGRRKSGEDGDQPGATVVAPVEQISVPGYELIELLGRGGMGEVWKAQQKSLERWVAVKVLPSRLAKDDEFVARFEKEATALAALSHPNIVQIIDRGVVGEHYFFAMEFVEGRTLRALLTEGLPHPHQAIRLTMQVLAAMDYAHKKNIVHRDLKPENILLGEGEHLKIADFGLVGIRNSNVPSPLTATSVAMGTVNYMAPEQRRDARNVDGRADIFSVGVILYELLTGELPVGRFRLPSEKMRGLDVRLDAIVTRALEASPEDRYSNAHEMLGDLEGLIDSRGSFSEKQQGALLFHRFIPSRQTVRVLLVASIIGLASGFIYFQSRKVFARALPIPANTDGELFIQSLESDLGNGIRKYRFDFVDGEEELNAHSGRWWTENGQLRAFQFGNEISRDELKLIPRTYVAQRYFSTDSFSAEVDVDVQRLDKEYELDSDAQEFAELSLRIRDLQISVFAIPNSGMRLGWRYFTPDGIEIAGNSARDLETLVEDEMPVPKGKFRVRLQMKRVGNAVDVEAFVNAKRFAHKVLPGLEGQTGKLAFGCRNLRCDFSAVEVSGKVSVRPGGKNP